MPKEYPPCAWCSGPIDPSTKSGKAHRRIYCSAECSASSTRARRDRAREDVRTQPTKVCSICAKDLPRSIFHDDKRRKDGLFPSFSFRGGLPALAGR
jgi:hypothetical protein